MMLALWNSTVLREMPRTAAISRAVRPSATSCRISRWRGVRLSESSPPSLGVSPDSRSTRSAPGIGEI